MGKLIVIEGLDGSGKATQTELLKQHFESIGIPVRKVSFPDYDSNSSALVKMYLSGEFGKKADDVNPYAASSFYAVDRYASYKKDWREFYESGGIILADRYTTSNAVHQCCKLPREQWDEFIEWLFNYEYKLLQIPAPYKTVYLRMELEVSHRLMIERYEGDKNRLDIHEKDMAYMECSQEAADYCAEKLGWMLVECCDGMELRSIEEIHNELISRLGDIG